MATEDIKYRWDLHHIIIYALSLQAYLPQLLLLYPTNLVFKKDHEDKTKRKQSVETKQSSDSDTDDVT